MAGKYETPMMFKIGRVDYLGVLGSEQLRNLLNR